MAEPTENKDDDTFTNELFVTQLTLNDEQIPGPPPLVRQRAFGLNDIPTNILTSDDVNNPVSEYDNENK